MSRTPSIRRRVFRLLSEPESGHAAKIINLVIVGLILLGVVSMMLSTVESVASVYGFALSFFEWITLSVFLIEYLLRLWSCVEDPRYSHAFWGRLRWIFSFYALIDLVAILPGLLPIIAADLRVLRLARILRIARLAKLGRYSRSLQMMGVVITRVWRDLVVVSVVLVLLLCVAATLMFYAEHHAQPDSFSSIPATLWWAVATLTTVGYGDVVPITTMGKILSSLLAIVGIGFVSLPTGILSAAYLDAIRQDRAERPSGEAGCDSQTQSSSSVTAPHTHSQSPQAADSGPSDPPRRRY